LLLDAYLIALRCTLPLAMRALPLPSLFRVIARRHRVASEANALRSIARAETIARRLRLPDTCLYRAMVRFAGLRAAGVDARFLMGVKRDAPEVGHAWVEVAGSPVGEAIDARLVATFTFPS
jgi:hypothetical protein